MNSQALIEIDKNNKEVSANTKVVDYNLRLKTNKTFTDKEKTEIKNSLFLAFNFNKEVILPSNEFEDLIKKSNLLEVDSEGYNCLFYAIINNSTLKLNNASWHHLIDNSDPDFRTKQGRSAFMLYCYQNSRQKLNFSKELVEKLLYKIKPEEIDIYKETSFSVAVTQYKKENLILKPKHWDYLIENVSSGADSYGLNPFMLALRFMDLGDVFFTYDQLKQLDTKCIDTKELLASPYLRVDKKRAIDQQYKTYLINKNIELERNKLNKAVVVANLNEKIIDITTKTRKQKI